MINKLVVRIVGAGGLHITLVTWCSCFEQVEQQHQCISPFKTIHTFLAVLAKRQKSLCDILSSIVISRPSIRPLATSPQKLPGWFQPNFTRRLLPWSTGQRPESYRDGACPVSVVRRRRPLTFACYRDNSNKYWPIFTKLYHRLLLNKRKVKFDNGRFRAY